MKLRSILIFLLVVVFFKFLFALIFFLCTPVVFLSLVALGVLVKAGLFAKLFRSKRVKPRNDQVVIEVEPIKMD